jgi:hypothetical protein
MTNTFAFSALFILVVLYFVPMIIAYGRNRKNAAGILLLNLFLGWTLLGWVIALIWAVIDGPKGQIEMGSSADELKKLADLKASGVLSEEEFQAKKKKILGV